MRCDTFPRAPSGSALLTLPPAVDRRVSGIFFRRPTLLTTQAEKTSTLNLIIQTLLSGSALLTLLLVVDQKGDGDFRVALPFLQLRQTN